MTAVRSLLVVTLFLLPGACVAQVFYPPFDVAFDDSLTLLRVEEIQKELQIDGEQNARFKEALTPLRKLYETRLKALEALPREQGSKQFADLKEKVKKEGLRVAKDQLKPEQFKRFQQIALQVQKYEAFGLPDVQKALKLSEDQKRQVQAVLNDRENKLKGLKVFTPGILEKLSDDTTKATLAILSQEQKTAWDGLVGQPFQFKRFGMMLRLK